MYSREECINMIQNLAAIVRLHEGNKDPAMNTLLEKAGDMVVNNKPLKIYRWNFGWAGSITLVASSMEEAKRIAWEKADRAHAHKLLSPEVIVIDGFISDVNSCIIDPEEFDIKDYFSYDLGDI